MAWKIILVATAPMRGIEWNPASLTKVDRIELGAPTLNTWPSDLRPQMNLSPYTRIRKPTVLRTLKLGVQMKKARHPGDPNHILILLFYVYFSFSSKGIGLVNKLANLLKYTC